MRRVVTAAEVEEAASSGASIVVDDTALVTPLARDRAAVLGVSLGGDPAPAQPAAARSTRTRSEPDVERLILESRVRTVARRTLLAHGRGLSGLEELVEAVMAKLGCGCDCECGGGR